MMSMILNSSSWTIRFVTGVVQERAPQIRLSAGGPAASVVLEIEDEWKPFEMSWAGFTWRLMKRRFGFPFYCIDVIGSSKNRSLLFGFLCVFVSFDGTRSLYLFARKSPFINNVLLFSIHGGLLYDIHT